MDKKIVFSVITAVVTVLPQGIFLKTAPIMSNEIILIGIAVSLFGGVMMSFALLKERKLKKIFLSKYMDLYTFFWVGVLCVGMPIIIRNLGESWNSQIFISPYFFTGCGIGLLIGGAFHWVSKNRGQKP